MPRSGSEADLGPNIAAVVGIYTLALLVLIAVSDFGIRSTLRAMRRRFANPS
jgi:hypothetical protein